MKQRFLGSIVAAALITTTVGADDTLMQRFDKMEKEMKLSKQSSIHSKLKKRQLPKSTVVAAPNHG